MDTGIVYLTHARNALFTLAQNPDTQLQSGGGGVKLAAQHA